MIHASEGSTHWYERGTGVPRYNIEGANGKMRPTTLRDARKLGLLPSVTTIIKCASAPQLEAWKRNQVMLAALTLLRLPGESDEAFCKRVLEDSGEQARKAAAKGTAIHAAIQGHYEGEPPSEEHWDTVSLVVDTLAQNCTAIKWYAEKSFGHELGFGGKCDLSSVSAGWVVDFKTKEFAAKAAPELKTWDEHAMQLAAYRMGLGLKDARCGIVYVSTLETACRLIEIDEAELAKGWEMFLGLLNYWQAKTGYRPSEWKEAA